MRQIIFSSLLLSVPLAALGSTEPQSTPPEDPQQQQQSMEPLDQRVRVEDPQTQQQQQQTQQQTPQTQQTQGQQEDQGSSTLPGTRMVSEEQQSGGEPELERAQFTSDVQDREPVDEVSEFEAGSEPLYFFTDVKNGAGETITHRWSLDGEVQAEVPLQVGSDDWRTWSSKELTPELEGEWTVEVVDSQGNTLTEDSITVEASQEAQTQRAGYSPDEQSRSGQSQGQSQDQGSGAQAGQSQDQSQSQQDTQSEEEDWQTEPAEVSYEDDMPPTEPEEEAARAGDDQRTGDDQ